MKTIKLILTTLVFAGILMFQSCSKDDNKPNNSASILPGSFKVDIPEAISSASTKKSKGDTIKGEDIYAHLRTFIAVGEGSADMVSIIIKAIGYYNINKPMTYNYVANNQGDDGRNKKLVVVENAEFEGQTYEFRLDIDDIDNGGGKAMQVFWNRNPIKGIAILNPYQCNHNFANQWGQNAQNVMYRVDYSEAKENGYDAQMTVYIDDLPMLDALIDPFAMNTLKMFAGRKGDIIEVYGNSNHPNAVLFTNDKGFNWAFVAASNRVQNIGIAEVGLPPSSCNSNERAILLDTNSIKNVFTKQIRQVHPTIDNNTLNAFLYNTNAPGYFNASGFVQAGNKPNSNYLALENCIKALVPYNPVAVTNLAIAFKQ